MAEAEPQAVDFWSELEEAAEMVEGWEEWRQRYQADVFELSKVSGSDPT